MSRSEHALLDLELRANLVRKDIVRMLTSAGSGHPGGSLSSVEILTSIFFTDESPLVDKRQSNLARNRFILSKGHAAPALYAVMHQLGFISEQELLSIRKLGSRLQGHPDSKFLPGIEVCTGSLGQGLSVGLGLALGLNARALEATKKRPMVYVLCGDGELQEGSNWEAVMYASHCKLNNLVLLVDKNGLQIDGTTDEVCSLGNLSAKFKAFGWNIHEVNGHDIGEICDALAKARNELDGPTAIVCHTIKGRGVSFMEGKREWHGVAPNEEQSSAALEELLAKRKLLVEGEHIGE